EKPQLHALPPAANRAKETPENDAACRWRLRRNTPPLHAVFDAQELCSGRCGGEVDFQAAIASALSSFHLYLSSENRRARRPALFVERALQNSVSQSNLRH